jgi:GntR family transcriptional regulator of arabinose operon
MTKTTKTKFTPAYIKLRDTLMNDIKNGTLKNGSRLPSENSLSKRFGIHRHTVRSSLRLLEEANLITSQPGKGWFICNSEDKNDKIGKKVIGLYGLSLFYWHSPSTTMFLNALLERCRKNNFELRFLCQKEFEMLVEDGIGKPPLDYFLFSGAAPKYYPALRSLAAHKVKTFVINRRLPGELFPFVAVDNYAGAYEVAGRLVAAGHRKIAFIGANLSRSYAMERWHGFCDALQGADIAIDKKRVLQLDHEQEIKSKIKGFLDVNRDITAIYIAGEVFQNTVFEYLFENQLNIPDDISIGAFDQFNVNWQASIPITTAEQPVQEMIAEVFQQIKAMEAGEKVTSRIFMPNIIDGQSIKYLAK